MLLIAGVVVGRWWIVPLGAAVWAVLLVVGENGCAATCLFGGAVLAAANATLGVLGHQAAARLIRAMRSTWF